MGFADLHLHTEWSDGMMSIDAIIQHVSLNCLLDVIAITDHDQIGGALDAFQRSSELGYAGPSVVVGIETTTRCLRHVVGLFFRPPFPEIPFPKFEPLDQTVSRIADFGGIAVVPHPMSLLVPSVHEAGIDRIVASEVGQHVVGIEVAAGVIGGRRYASDIRAKNASRWHLAEVGASDAHHLEQVGSAFTWFPGKTSAELEAALISRRTKAMWGKRVRVPISDHARQVWRAWAISPFRPITSRTRAMP